MWGEETEIVKKDNERKGRKIEGETEANPMIILPHSAITYSSYLMTNFTLKRVTCPCSLKGCWISPSVAPSAMLEMWSVEEGSKMLDEFLEPGFLKRCRGEPVDEEMGEMYARIHIP